MFVLRGVAVSLTFFVVLYCLLSLLVAIGWRTTLLFKASARQRANLLFWLRILPLLASASVTLSMVVPAYVRFEPRSIEEDMILPSMLAICCLFLFGLGVWRVVAAQRMSARIVTDWLMGAHVLHAGAAAPLVQANSEAPPLMLVGVCAPRVVISEATLAVLSAGELHVAVQHEMAHLKFHDNLKKLIFHCSPFPAMSSLEGAWQEAAELAADDGAVTSVREALDLAAALIKLSRLVRGSTPEFTMALVGSSASVRLRVDRLLAWSEVSARIVDSGWSYAVVPAIGVSLVAIASYSPALTQIHRVSEWFVH